jgi:hypothetical protein
MENAHMSYRPMVMVDGESKWVGNGLRFGTAEEAMQSARDTMGRWMLVTDVKVEESADPVNYRWVAGVGLERVAS